MEQIGCSETSANINQTPGKHPKENTLDFLHAATLRHGTDGFTSSPKEGAMRIFSAEKSAFEPV
jgi:hypothetical protein